MSQTSDKRGANVTKTWLFSHKPHKVYVDELCPARTMIDWCCFYYFVRNGLVALLETLYILYLSQNGGSFPASSTRCCMIQVVGCARNHEDMGGARRGSRGSEFTRIWIDKNLKLDIFAQWQRLKCQCTSHRNKKNSFEDYGSWMLVKHAYVSILEDTSMTRDSWRDLRNYQHDM